MRRTRVMLPSAARVPTITGRPNPSLYLEYEQGKSGGKYWTTTEDIKKAAVFRSMAAARRARDKLHNDAWKRFALLVPALLAILTCGVWS